MYPFVYDYPEVTERWASCILLASDVKRQTELIHEEHSHSLVSICLATSAHNLPVKNHGYIAYRFYPC